MIPQPSFSLASSRRPGSTVSGETPSRGDARAAKAPARPVKMDRIDRMIVAELQRDATLPLVRLADRVGLSQTPCWKRIRKLEESGVITRRVALVDPDKAGLGLTAFVAVTAADHSPSSQASFVEVVAALPEVIEVWRMAGEADYLLKVVVRDLPAFDAFYRRLVAVVEFKNVSSQLALERVVHTTALPIPSDGP